MNKPKVDEELLKRVDEVLHYIWDPIGVCGMPEARSEYSSYTPVVTGMLTSSASVDEISRYLFFVVTDRMGLEGDLVRDRETAEVLVNWFESIHVRRL